MSHWLLRRLLGAAVTLLLALTLVFFLMRLAPGDPLSRLSDDRPLPPETIAALRARYGLDQSLPRQYAAFVGGALRGDLGGSIEHGGRPVLSLLGERLPATLLLGGSALLLNFTFGVWLGVWQAGRRGSAADHAMTVVTLTAYATPSFLLGIVLAWGLAVELRWFPVGFMHAIGLPPDAGPLTRLRDLLWHLTLPVATLSAGTIGATVRFQRAAMIEAFRLEAVRTARAKGLPERVVRWRHAWRNALGPMLALFGLWLPLLVAGSVFVEQIFSWPGLGSLVADAIGARDYPVLMGATVLVSATIIGGNLLADVLQRWLDPRLRAA
ncbi:MAG: ABC transporter permease [Gemmatimonadales bacterium]|nr:ABC transporter permease [Gemmatimonadales bacterium]